MGGALPPGNVKRGFFVLHMQPVYSKQADKTQVIHIYDIFANDRFYRFLKVLYCYIQQFQVIHLTSKLSYSKLQMQRLIRAKQLRVIRSQ